MKYDDASWHYSKQFPGDLPQKSGATHIEMFVAWAMLNGLAGDLHGKNFPQALELLRQRKITPAEFVMVYCDETFTEEVLNEEGNRFAQLYFDPDVGDYVDDYENILAKDLPTIYHVPDNWESYDRLAPTIDDRFGSWPVGEIQGVNVNRNESESDPASKPWWRFW